jgi:hypothetical protein
VNRRAFLAATTGTAAALAGCSFGADSPTSLGPPTVDEGDDAGVRYHNFDRAGEHALDVDLSTGPRRRADAPAPVTLSVTPYDGLTTQRVRWTLRAPPGDGPDGGTATVFATTGSTGDAPVTVARGDDGDTVVTVGGLDGFGSTLVLRARVVPRTAVAELATRVEVALRGSGGPYSATVDRTLPMPV